jgi:serine/threonine protein kinase
LEFPDDIPIEDDLRDLLCRLLTKDFERRITLEQVRSHAWVTADLEDPELWKEEADPRHYKAVEVTDEEVSRAVTITEKIRRGIQKLSSSISHFTQAFDMKRRGKSLSSQGHSPSIKPTVSDRSTSDTAHPPAVDHSRDQYQTMSQYASNGGEQLVTSPNTRGETLSPDSLSQEMILLPHCEPSNDSGHNGSYGQSDNESYSRQNDDHKYDNEGYEDEYSDYDTGPWPLERKDSSASTLSGLIIGRGRQRSADADNM